MSQFSEDDRLELAQFLHSAAGIHLINHLREVHARMPPYFTPTDGNMAPHHIQLHHAFGVGESAKLEQIVAMAESKTKPPEPEPVTLFDGKTLGR